MFKISVEASTSCPQICVQWQLALKQVRQTLYDKYKISKELIFKQLGTLVTRTLKAAPIVGLQEVCTNVTPQTRELLCVGCSISICLCLIFYLIIARTILKCDFKTVTNFL